VVIVGHQPHVCLVHQGGRLQVVTGALVPELRARQLLQLRVDQLHEARCGLVVSRPETVQETRHLQGHRGAHQLPSR
jgi:hypothetical protein